MHRSRAPRGLWFVVGSMLLAATGVGCAATGRGPVMTPAGPRWLGPADPIAAGRPAAITFDPYQPGGIPQPRGLARFFPGSGGQPGTNPAPMEAPAPTALAARAVPERPAPAPADIAPASDSPRMAESEVKQSAGAVLADTNVPILPIGITLETYPIPPGSADPDARLTSRDEPLPAPPSGSSGALATVGGALVSGPEEIPDVSEQPDPPQLPADGMADDPTLRQPERRPRLLDRLRAIRAPRLFRRGRSLE